MSEQEMFEIDAGAQGVTRVREDGGFMIMSAFNDADTIKLPQELGGALERITGRGVDLCVCKEHNAPYADLETKRVYECGRQFLWMIRPLHGPTVIPAKATGNG